MPSLRGSIIAVPYDYSDLTSSKVRPALIVSSDAYNRTRPDVVAAGISSQIAKSGLYDHILVNWSTAGLRYPSLVRGRLLTLEQSLIRRVIGRVSASDLAAFEQRLAAFLLSGESVADYLLTQVNLTMLSGRVVQSLALKTLQASLALADDSDPGINLAQLQALFLAPGP